MVSTLAIPLYEPVGGICMRNWLMASPVCHGGTSPATAPRSNRGGIRALLALLLGLVLLTAMTAPAWAQADTSATAPAVGGEAELKLPALGSVNFLGMAG